MKFAIDKLLQKVVEKNSHICVGLDPHPEYLPDFLIEKYSGEFENKNEVFSQAVLEFNQNIIDNIADIAVAVKPQIAFYELLGIPGLQTLQKTTAYARQKGLIIILDAKRNDIGSTAAAYAEAYLGLSPGVDSPKKLLENNFKVDWLTINPYLGFDGIEPFIAKKDKGAFVLVRTSNKSAGDIQDLITEEGLPVYHHTGQLVSHWGETIIGDCGYSNLGAVVGATYPEELKKLRKTMPHSYFLLPGFGFQGGRAADISYGFNQDGRGSLINSSRGINFAYRFSLKNNYHSRDYAVAAREAALKMKDEINQIIKEKI